MTEVDLNLWDPAVPIPDRDAVPEIDGVELISVMPLQPEVDGYQFHHGAAIAVHRDELFVSVGVNRGVENTAGEEAVVLRSRDMGRTWTEPAVMETPAAQSGITHGVFLEHEDRLWAFQGAFGNIVGTEPPGRNRSFKNIFPGLCVRAYTFNEGTGNWDSHGTVCDNFIPYQEPVRLTNGNWFTSGMNRDFLAAVAVSNGNDLTQWRAINVPMPDSPLRANETAFWTDGTNITAVIRSEWGWSNETGAFRASVSYSRDCGESWTPAAETNCPLSVAKPYCGVLSTGQRYLLGNSINSRDAARRYLTIALAKPGEARLCSLSLFRDVALHPPPAGQREVAALAYPYAIELNGCLYVVHSAGGGSNINSIDLAIVPLDALA